MKKDRDSGQAARDEEAVQNGRNDDWQSLLTYFAENSNYALARVSPDGAILSMSPSARNVLGDDAENFINQRAFTSAFPEDKERAIREFEEFLQSQEDRWQLIYRRFLPGGYVIWVEADGQKIRDVKTGEVLEILAIVRNVTDRVRAEQALQKSEEQLRKQNHRLKILNEISMISIASTTGEDLCNQVVSIVRANIPCDAFYVSPYDEKSKTTTTLVNFDTIDGHFQRVATSHAEIIRNGKVFKEVIQNKKVLIVHRENPERESSGYVKFGNEGKLSASLMYAPLISGNRVLGFLSTQSYDFNAFTSEHEELFGAIACQVGPALEAVLLREETQQREEQLRMFIEYAPAAIAVLDKHLLYLSHSRRWLKYFNLEGQNIIGLSHEEIFPRSSVDWGQVLQSCLVGESQYGDADSFLHPNGKKEWFRWGVHPWKDTGGQIGGLIIFTELITHQVEAERALRESEERFRTLFESVADAIMIHIHGEDKFLEVNPEACRRLGYTRQEFLALGPEDIDDPAMKPEIERKVAPLQKEGNVVFESVHVTKEGKKIPVEISAQLLETEERKMIISVSRDISARKQAEETMLRASRMEATSTLAGGIAHDFNNLMVGVLGNAEILKEQLEDQPEVGKMLDQIGLAAQQAGELAQQMLAFARGGRYLPRIVDLNETIVEAVRLQGYSCPPSIHLETELDPTLWNIYADPAQMVQIVMNLSLNAIESIQDAGQVFIRTRNSTVEKEMPLLDSVLPAEKYVLLEVQDSGSGMDEGTRKKIFEPFFTTKFQGRGLGLSAVFGIVQNHGGQINVQSVVGKGTLVQVYLPATEVRMPSAPPEEGKVKTGEETIMVVDDEEMVLDVTTRILEKRGYTVLKARNGLEAIDAAEKQPKAIDLVLLDMGMPVMGGAETFENLKKRNPDIKVIICSGYEMDNKARHMLKNGASTFMQKPFRGQNLLSEIRKVLDN